jgi:hypothetical protein
MCSGFLPKKKSCQIKEPKRDDDSINLIALQMTSLEMIHLSTTEKS